MALGDEIQARRAEIRSDGYPMSIGELVLGIPLPSVFLSQRDDGVWDVVDGLQRLATILEFMGVLKDERGDCVPPLVLTSTKYLPSLENRTWRDDETREGIGSENQLIIKRSKIDIKIILRESSETSKYELFQRLNMGDSQLSSQEFRNVLMIMADPTLYRWVADLARSEHFRRCVAISERASLEQYDLELVCRFLVLRDLEERQLRSIPEFGEFLIDSVLRLAEASQRERDPRSDAFVRTFEILARALEDDSFRRYDHQRGRHLGAFLISAFEVVAMGLGFNVSKPDYLIEPERVRTVARGIWQDAAFLKSIGSGVRASSRIPVTIPRGRTLFA
jgi:hypothetical protein